MTNSSEIEIAKIEKLKAIYFYYVGDESNEMVLGLRILYDNDKILDYDYRYKFFNDYVSRVLEVYKNEKKENNIILYSELTEEIVKNFKSKSKKTISIDEMFDEYKLNLHSIDNFVIRDVSCYIERIILSVLEILTSDKNSYVNNIKGFKNKFIAECVTTKGNILIPFHCIKRNDSYEFKLFFPNNYLLKSICGNIKFSSDDININWNNFDKSLFGEYFYNLKTGMYNESIVNKYDQNLYYNNELNNISEEKKEIISKYADIVGMKCDKIVSFVPNNYIVIDEKNRNADESVIYKRKVSYITIEKDYASIVYFYIDGIIKYDGTFDFPFMSEYIETKLIPFDYDNEHYILKEVSVLPTDKMSGLYKQNVGKYNYSLMKVDQNSDLRMPFVIEDRDLVDAKDISNLMDVKKYVKERKKGL